MTDTANETGREQAAGPQRGSLGGAKPATDADVAMKAGKVEPSLSRRGKIALGYAKRGWHVFPITPGQKYPPLVQWSVEATTNTQIVRRWWERWPDANIGISCGPSGLCVIDLDVDHRSAAGQIEFQCLVETHGDIPITRSAMTARGGAHLYFAGKTASNIKKLGRHIDVKSVGGYVVAPGSTVDGLQYDWEADIDAAPLPGWLADLIGKPKEKKEREAEPPAGFDNPADIERARHMLRETEAKARYDGSDNQTYQIACRLHDMGISKETACDLMNSEWGHRHDLEWVEGKVRNAFEYATGAAGSDSVIGDFLDELEPPESPQPKKRRGRFMSVDEVLSLPPPQWLVHGLVPLESVGVLYGPSGSLKSFLAFHLAACCATGREAFPEYGCKDADAFYIAAEGGHGFKLRTQAWIKHHGTKPDRLHLLPGSVYLDKDGEAEKLAEEVNALSLSDDRKLIVVDTLSANFTGKENTDDVARFLQRCAKLARMCTATVIIVHHTGKDGDKQERGHYSIRANADFSIRMDRTPEGAKVEVQKLKDADVGQPLHLRAISVEVAPGAEFSSSLVLEKGEGAVDQFDRLDARDDIEALISRSDGLPLIKVAQALRSKWKKHDNTLKAWVQKAIGEPGQRPRKIVGGTTWMERAASGNGLIVRFSGTPAAQTPL